MGPSHLLVGTRLLPAGRRTQRRRRARRAARTSSRISGVVAALHGSTFGIGLLFAGVFGVQRGRSHRPAVGAAGGGDRPGRRASCCSASGPSWPVTLLGTAFSGRGGALLVMVMPGLISDHHGEHRAEAFAAVNGAPGVAGVAFSLVIGGALSAGWSWRPPYLILTGVFTLALVFVAWPVAVPDGERHGTFSLRHFRDREVLRPVGAHRQRCARRVHRRHLGRHLPARGGARILGSRPHPRQRVRRDDVRHPGRVAHAAALVGRRHHLATAS